MFKTFFKKNTNEPDSTPPVLPPLTNSDAEATRTCSTKNASREWSSTFICAMTPEQAIQMPLPPNSKSVFSKEHLSEDTTSLLVPLSKDPKNRREEDQEVPSMETPPQNSPRLQGSQIDTTVSFALRECHARFPKYTVAETRWESVTYKHEKSTSHVYTLSLSTGNKRNIHKYPAYWSTTRIFTESWPIIWTENMIKKIWFSLAGKEMRITTWTLWYNQSTPALAKSLSMNLSIQTQGRQ